MKPYYEDIAIRKGQKTFLAYSMEVPSFEFKWHYHPEYELTLITAGSGKRLVGDSHESFGAGDLVLIGPSMPHTWVSDPFLDRCSAVVVQFPEAFLQPLIQFREFEAVRTMLNESKSGLVFPGEQPRGLLEHIADLPGPEQLISLYTVLEYLSRQPRKVLASQDFIPVVGSGSETRINKVCRYVQRNIDRKFRLDEVAGLIHLSESAFCKFFKRATGKTFSDYVNEVRISRACALLTGSDQSIGAIAYACGFENLAYFNRVFLRKKSINPKAFRERFFQLNSSEA